MNITLHIKALLYRHDCVVVPGFGAFLAQFQSAKIDEEQNLFYPPIRSIRFNAQLKNNDGLLLNYLETENGLNYVEAQNAIKDFVVDVETTLIHQGNVVFKELGRFTYQNENQLVFEPFSNNFLLDAFGLDSLSNAKIVREVKLATEEKQAAKVVVLSSEKRNLNVFLRYAAAGIITIGIASMLGYAWYTNDVKEHNLQVQNKVQQEVNSKIQNAEFSITEPLPSLQIQTKAPALPKNIHIVGGAFREEANAEKKLRQLQQQGFDASLIGKNKYGLHQVAFSSFSDAQEAKIQLRKIKKNHLKSAWLLIQ
jgi:nucleoid DNA-binding protein